MNASATAAAAAALDTATISTHKYCLLCVCVCANYEFIVSSLSANKKAHFSESGRGSEIEIKG